jgi:hypothetical protein
MPTTAVLAKVAAAHGYGAQVELLEGDLMAANEAIHNDTTVAASVAITTLAYPRSALS